jgi:Fic family protein
MKLEILSLDLLPLYKKALIQSPLEILNRLEKADTPVDYFQFYNSVSSVYSSKIEGENIDFDSFFKHKFMNIKYQPDYTKKADDLYLAYEFVFKNKLTLQNLQKAHSILSANLLPKSQQGLIRNNPMFVINSNDRIEYIATEPSKVKIELERLFKDISSLQETNLDPYAVFYFASYIHLAFLKIHLFQDGNGRAARLLEKWFLIEKLGDKATAVQLEKNYYQNLENYYSNIKKLGADYEDLDFTKCLDFLLMTATGIQSQ